MLITNATILDGVGGRLEGGSVLLAGGGAAAVGASVGAPAGVAVIDGSGRWVTPGIIDIHSHLGVYARPSTSAHSDGNESVSPNTVPRRRGDEPGSLGGHWSRVLASG